MLRQFSSELAEDREFEIGGEVFRFRYPLAEETAKLWDSDLSEETNGNWSWTADLKTAVDGMLLFIDPEFNDGHGRWKALVKRKKDAVPRFQIIDAYRWLFNLTGGLPTTPPSPSEGGGGNEDTSSEDASPSQEETPAE